VHFFTVITIPKYNALQNIVSKLILLFTASFVYYFYVRLFLTASPAALQITCIVTEMGSNLGLLHLRPVLHLVHS
jgi:hypothetical protein